MSRIASGCYGRGMTGTPSITSLGTPAPIEFLDKLARALKQRGDDATKLPPALEIIAFEQTSSTMDVAQTLHSESAGFLQGRAADYDQAFGPQPFVVLSRAQSKGRGRRGRSWHSVRDAGLYLTLSFRPASAPRQLIGLSLAVGVAVVRMLKSFGARAELKWPNDIVSTAAGQNGYKKIGGILVELSTRSSSEVVVHAGVGLNLYPAKLPEELAAGSVYETLGVEIDYFDAFGELVRQMVFALRCFVSEGFPPFREEWKEHSMMLGKAIKIEQDSAVVRGSVVDVDSDGGLIVSCRSAEGSRDENRTIYSGEIVLEDAARD